MAAILQLLFMTSNRKPTAYLLGEQSYQISSRNKLKRRNLIGRIHGAIVAATGRSDRRGDDAIVAATIAATTAPYIHCRRLSPRRSPVVCTWGDCRGDRRGDDCRDNRRDSHLVYTLQEIVAATIAPTVAATIAPCIRRVFRSVYPHFYNFCLVKFITLRLLGHV